MGERMSEVKIQVGLLNQKTIYETEWAGEGGKYESAG